MFNNGKELAYILLYVDDIIITGSSSNLVNSSISALSSVLDISDLGRLHHFLGISVTYNDTGIFLSQQNYVADILHRASMTNCNPCLTPVDTKSKLADDDGPRVSDPSLYRSLAGVLQYLTFTRPDIAYAVQQVCLFARSTRAASPRPETCPPLHQGYYHTRPADH